MIFFPEYMTTASGVEAEGPKWLYTTSTLKIEMGNDDASLIISENKKKADLRLHNSHNFSSNEWRSPLGCGVVF